MRCSESSTSENTSKDAELKGSSTHTASTKKRRNTVPNEDFSVSAPDNDSRASAIVNDDDDDDDDDDEREETDQPGRRRWTDGQSLL